MTMLVGEGVKSTAYFKNTQLSLISKMLKHWVFKAEEAHCSSSHIYWHLQGSEHLIMSCPREGKDVWCCSCLFSNVPPSGGRGLTMSSFQIPKSWHSLQSNEGYAVNSQGTLQNVQPLRKTCCRGVPAIMLKISYKIIRVMSLSGLISGREVYQWFKFLWKSLIHFLIGE